MRKTNLRYLCVFVLALSLLFPASALAKNPTNTQLAKKKNWTYADMKVFVKREAPRYKITTQLATVNNWAYRIVWGGKARESSGATKLKTALYWGMWQFNSSWKLPPQEQALAKREKHGHELGNSRAWQLCGACSTRRWMRAMRDYRLNYSRVLPQWPTVRD